MHQEHLRRIPQMDRALGWPEVAALVGPWPRAEVARALREVLEGLRSDLLAGRWAPEGADGRLAPAGIARAVRRVLGRRARPAYPRAVNATGVLLHTGLGRAPFPEAAVQAFQESLRGHSVVEIDRASGERGRREGAVADLLCEVTGAPAATVVNNNAGATLLVLAALARGRQVLISRGQLVEIGGSFRMPDILAESGARLREVGTTNRTYLEDYERAVDEEAGLILDVHTSNYEIRGFTCRPAIEELVAMGHARGLPVASDLGSGCLTDLARFGVSPEPLVSRPVKAGCDAVCFSGDKLLGGPQAGVVLGSRSAVERVRSHPLFRCLRVDKTTLVLLETVLRLWRDPDRALAELPALAALGVPAGTLRARADRILARLDGARAAGLEIELVESTAEMGGGSLPARELPSWALAVRSPLRKAGELAARLRAAEPPVFSRVRDERVWLDLRSVLPSDDDDLARVLDEVAREASR